jgi:hypothetical protein
MARRPGEDGRFNLSPRALRIAGWVAAFLIVLGIAGMLRILGGNGDGAAILASGGGSPASSLAAIAFGTSLDAERQVPTEARVARFARGDTFAYSVADAEPTSVTYVEVVRTTGGVSETVQQPTGAQPLPDGPSLIGYTVAADILLDAFGPGEYVMRIFLAPEGSAIAEGTFELVDTVPSASGGS